MPAATRLLVSLALLLLAVLEQCTQSSPETIQYSFARTRTPLEQSLNPTWRATNRVFRMLAGRSNDPRVMRELRVRKNLQQQERGDRRFPCNVSEGRSTEPPSSVHRLRPGDVDVVAAMGDSLTAANGALALNLLQVTNENRGVSWSGGGQGTWREWLTLPNILKEFNQDLVGYSLNDSRAYERSSVFNVAEINAMSQDLPWQATNLVKRMRSHPRVDLQNHWKLVTVLVGSNDFCSDMCYRKSPESLPEQHRQDLQQALRILKQNLPRTFVNLVIQPDVGTIMQNQRNATPLCQAIRRVACSCLFGEQFRPQRQRMNEIVKRYVDMEFRIAEDPEFQSDDFTVVAQPFTHKVKFPLKSPTATDFSYMSPDCFHFSQRGYARAATGVWNNMLEPVGSKTPDWPDRFLCPTEERPYIATKMNS